MLGCQPPFPNQNTNKMSVSFIWKVGKPSGEFPPGIPDNHVGERLLPHPDRRIAAPDLDGRGHSEKEPVQLPVDPEKILPLRIPPPLLPQLQIPNPLQAMDDG